ncbi:MAG: hypothetical protein M0P64_02355 [Candidatus Pacebacteria bacterium]|jgi:hypothetical protein|nr:hypothetical protein [Candidatus Paceibacterota bacterium]
MNVIRFVMFAFFLCFSNVSVAFSGPTDAERKEAAAREYAYCMFLGKFVGVSGVISYIQGQQTGSSLYSNSEKLAQENCIADTLGLMRYRDLDEIVAADDGFNLVPIAAPFIVVNNGVPRERHLSRPWARDYLFDIAQYYRKISSGKKLRVASLVRSRIDQKGLSEVKKFYRRVKGRLKIILRKRRSFADCSSSAVCSTHLTGAAIDVSLRGVSKKERVLLSERFLRDREAGRILVIYERVGNHFHVFVLPKQNVFYFYPAPYLDGVNRESIVNQSVTEILSQPPAE